MSYFIIFALAPFALIAAVNASAQAPSAPPSSQLPADAGTIDVIAKRLCKAEPIVGTRIPVRRKCDTPAQLAQYQQQARELLESYRRRPCAMGTESGNNQVMPC